MTVMKSKSNNSHPDEVSIITSRLGERIRLARIRRKLRQSDLASRTNLSRSTIQSIERGDNTCSLGSVVHVLWMLGISNEINLVADPGLDREGLALSIAEGGFRVCIPRVVDNDF